MFVQDEAEWNLIPPLPSYGTGRDAPGPRFISLIFGTNLTDVVITGKYPRLLPIFTIKMKQQLLRLNLKLIGIGLVNPQYQLEMPTFLTLLFHMYGDDDQVETAP